MQDINRPEYLAFRIEMFSKSSATLTLLGKDDSESQISISCPSTVDGDTWKAMWASFVREYGSCLIGGAHYDAAGRLSSLTVLTATCEVTANPGQINPAPVA